MTTLAEILQLVSLLVHGLEVEAEVSCQSAE